MSSAAMDSILNSAACRGAFRMKGNEIEPLKAGASALGEQAQRTRNLWAHVGAMVSDSGLMIAKKQDALSVASAKGGLILETSGPLNIGMLKVAVQDEARVTPSEVEVDPDAAGPGPKAVWSLARWIERIETRRALKLTAGSKCWTLWAEKGRFGLEPGKTVDTLIGDMLSAGKSGAPIELTYVAWDDAAVSPVLEPTELFMRKETAEYEWMIFEDGCLAALPNGASLEQAHAATALAQQLAAWCAGHPFEVAVFGEGAMRHVVAHAETPDRILISKAALGATAVRNN